MQIGKLPSCSVFDEDQVKILTAAFDEALRLSEINDRNDLRAESVAERIITTFVVGERDPKRIARIAAAN